MLLRTHIMFSWGLSSIVAALAVNQPVLSIGATLPSSYIINYLIDMLGHEERHGHPVRSPRTHTIGRSLLLSLLIGMPYSLALYYVVHLTIIQLSALATSMALVGWSHLLLDSVTEGGVFIRRRGRWVRFSLAHFRFNNPVLNGFFTILGLAMLILSALFTVH